MTFSFRTNVLNQGMTLTYTKRYYLEVNLTLPWNKTAQNYEEENNGWEDIYRDRIFQATASAVEGSRGLAIKNISLELLNCQIECEGKILDAIV